MMRDSGGESVVYERLIFYVTNQIPHGIKRLLSSRTYHSHSRSCHAK